MRQEVFRVEREEKFGALKPQEIAQRLNVDIRTVYKMIERGDLHAVRAGRVWRIPPEAFEEYLRGSARSPASA